MKRVILLGSTGFIGRSAIEVIKSLKEYKIVAIAGHTNHQKLIEQANEIKPKAVAITNEKYYKLLRRELSVKRLFCGERGMIEMVQNSDADIIIIAIASSLGVYSLLEAIKKKMRICLATKEILVSFGEIVMKEVKKNNSELIPIDSEHSAIFQCLEGRKRSQVSKIILTASGGPFFKKRVKNVTRADVLRHPVWKMGNKITVDSATLMNKGLEVIEAHHLFDMAANQIKVVIHPEAICHSCVQFIDGSLICQLSTPDMKLPIQYALTTPERLPTKIPSLGIERVRHLNFYKPDYLKFPCLGLAYDALKIGRSMPAVLNGANTEAVKLFLEEKIKFVEIPEVISKTMSQHIPVKADIAAYAAAEDWAREKVKSMVLN